MQIKKYLIIILLLSFMLACWYLVYLSQYAGYDLNYGLFFLCLFLATVGSVLSIAILVSKTQKRETVFLIFCTGYLIIASPVTFLVFIKIYAAVYGGFFKL